VNNSRQPRATEAQDEQHEHLLVLDESFGIVDLITCAPVSLEHTADSGMIV
jgi:hypothetical protein